MQTHTVGRLSQIKRLQAELRTRQAAEIAAKKRVRGLLVSLSTYIAATYFTVAPANQTAGGGSPAQGSDP